MPKWNISPGDNLKINNHKKSEKRGKLFKEQPSSLFFLADFKRPSNKQVIFVLPEALIIQNHLCLNQHWNN